MSNSYERVIVEDPQAPHRVDEIKTAYRQGEFLRRNHHLISPWRYTAEQIKARNQALFLMHVELAERERRVVIPMATSPEMAALDPLLHAAMERAP